MGGEFCRGWGVLDSFLSCEDAEELSPSDQPAPLILKYYTRKREPQTFTVSRAPTNQDKSEQQQRRDTGLSTLLKSALHCAFWNLVVQSHIFLSIRNGMSKISRYTTQSSSPLILTRTTADRSGEKMEDETNLVSCLA